MDFFGQALLAYYQGERKPFYLSDAGNTFEQPLKKYFREYRQFDKIEKKLISLARGNILDVGCGTGIYIPHLMKRGNVIGIDISPTVIRVAKARGLKNCKAANIFTWKPKQKFDTITLIENNLGIAETPEKTKKLLKKLSSLLTENGQILSNCGAVQTSEFYIHHYTTIYNGKKGQPFKWISFNEKYLAKICKETELKMQIIGRKKYEYLAKINKLH